MKGKTSKFIVKLIVCVLNNSKGAKVITFVSKNKKRSGRYFRTQQRS